MSRIKLAFPLHVHFATELPVRISDINYGGHLGNDAVLSLLHEARVRFLRQSGYTEQNIEGVGIIMADVVIVYKAEGFYGDILNAEVTVTNIEATGCDIFYRLSKKEDGTEVAVAKTGIVFFDYEHRKPVRTPRRFGERFALHGELGETP